MIYDPELNALSDHRSRRARCSLSVRAVGAHNLACHPQTMTGELLVPEGVDGVEVGGFGGWVDAEDQADATGDADG